MQDNLPELRDIHIPEGVSIFPPAYGWWVILLCLLSGIIIYKAFITIRSKSKKFYALKLISQINTNNIISSAVEISEILRRICIYKYPAANAVFGKEWIIFLNNHSKSLLHGKPADLLVNAPYIPTNTSFYNQNDIDELVDFSKKWIGENL